MRIANFAYSQSCTRNNTRSNNDFALVSENLNEPFEQVDRFLRGMQAGNFLVVITPVRGRSIEIAPI